MRRGRRSSATCWERPPGPGPGAAAQGRPPGRAGRRKSGLGLHCARGLQRAQRQAGPARGGGEPAGRRWHAGHRVRAALGGRWLHAAMPGFSRA